MKKLLLLFLIIISLSNCNSDDAIQSGCVSELLPNYPFDTGSAININLPQYNGLQFGGNSLYVSGYSVRGFYLYNTGSSIVAFEASDPAHAPNECSLMTLSGIELTCPCEDGNKYELLTGQQISGDSGNCLRAYRVEQIGSIVRVFN
jgi:hypothetical protein|tara:strand:- start:52 stop:492 length:441 start_codon:yes stop_codon:yes gene_type:complete